MCKNDYTFFTNVVRLCAYIILNMKKKIIIITFKPRKTCVFTSNSTFHSVNCC